MIFDNIKLLITFNQVITNFNAMKKITLIIFLLFYSYSFSQNYINGFIFDKSSNKSLPYAKIRLISDKDYYTITNEDGKFEFQKKFASDSIEVRYIGYKSKKVLISYFKNNYKLLLEPEVYKLNAVNIIAKKEKNYSYKLLIRLIKKYRNNKKIVKSKGFLNLNTSIKGVPLEIIEGFYNSEHTLSKGITDLKIKSGRFGQNRSFPFYSLNSTDILKDFQLFNISPQILPQYPGNLALNVIKRKYKIKIDQCDNCSYDDMVISFVPKKMNGRLFFGKIIFNKETLTIKKIELRINNPTTYRLTSIIENHEVIPKEITLDINFNPNNYEQIQSLEYKFIMYYNSKESFKIIETRAFLYCYDYYKTFDEPFFTNIIKFNNDYDKIIALQATNDFWDANYQFPKSFKALKSIEFLKEYGILINYENVIPINDIDVTRPSVISWSKNERLKWESVKQGLNESENSNKYSNRNLSTNMKADNVYHSSSDIVKKNPFLNNYQSFIFSYLLDKYRDSNGENHFITRTIFDRNSSSYKNSRTKNMLIYLNLSFDIYEYYRQKLASEINNEMTFSQVKVLCNETFKKATQTVEKMKMETNSGLNFQNLMRWNNEIKSKLNIDNYYLISNQKQL